MKIRAAVLTAPDEPFRIEELTLDDPKRGEVLVRVAAVGVCHSDWNLVTGATKHPMPVVPGHEGAGVAEAVGPDVHDVRVGDHVILNWAPNYGRCLFCRRDSPHLCCPYDGSSKSGTW